jgi:tetratricopeptide (TPR) repeat protein
MVAGATWMLAWCSTAVIGALGYYAEQYLRLYGGSIKAMKYAHRVGRLPFFRADGMHVHAAMNLGSAYIDMGDFATADYWAQIALATKTQGDWKAQSEALSVAGEVAYYQGNFDRARSNLLESINIYRNSLDSYSDYLFKMSNEASEYNAKNLHMLADMALAENDLEKAKLFFLTGVKLRHECVSLKDTSKAYRFYAEGRLYAHDGDTARATDSFREAAQSLPSTIRLRQHRDVLVLVAQALNSLDSASVALEKMQLERLLVNLHPTQEAAIARQLAG